ncbi:MAG: DUF4286 family protein [Bacteroidetes bacterium]|nr:MAG: DUF4286 family protein [Bacteroidota bacterium]
MIIYNVTVKIDRDVHDEWLTWMKEVHIPEVMDTNLFVDHQICRLLSVDESDGITYAIQYRCKNLAGIEKYQREFAARLQKAHTDRYKDKFVAFRTLMEVV